MASLAAVMLCALPLSAQVTGEGRAAPMDVTHAEIGTLMGVDADGTLTTSYPIGDGDYVHRTYRTGPTTAVEGLGGIMGVDEIPADVLGSVVVVEFVHDMGRPMATRLQFPTAREIRVTHGSIVGIDVDARRLRLANADGVTEMELGIGYGVTIDDNMQGIVSLDDLEYGQDVAVYYAEAPGLSTQKNMSKIAYLIMRAG